MSALQGALRHANICMGRSFLRPVPGLPAHGPELVDGENLHGSTFLGSRQGDAGSAKMEMRVLPPQFRQLSEAQGSVQFPAVEEVCPAGGRAPKPASNRIGQSPHSQRLSGFSQAKKASRVHGTIERTTGMLGVRSATGCLRFIVSRSPATPFGARRVNAKNASSSPASSRSRKLGTAFRSPVTTLSPPLRGQRSRPAPSLPRRCFFAYPLDRRLLRSVRFRSRNRANSSPSTRCPRRSPALL